MGLAETAELAVRISLKDNVSAGVRGLQRNLRGLDGSLGRVGKGVGQIGTGLARAGLLIGGAAITGIGAAAKAAIDFEDAFAGVRKTVNQTELDKVGLTFDELAKQFRTMATEMPITAVELARIGETAGALGVKAQDIATFTKTVATLGVTTNLSTDAAAEALGKVGTILNLTGSQITDFADVLVNLGNQGASTESEIIEVTKRFAAMGRQAGLTTPQILALSSAATSLGAEPEAAGSALSRIFANMTVEIANATSKGKAFASITGDSLDTLKKRINQGDALGILMETLQGLGKLSRTEGASVLKALGINNVRDRNAILLMSQNLGFVNDQLRIADSSSGALARETAIKFGTIAAKLTVLKNNLVEAGIAIGEGMLPALGRATDKLVAFLKAPGNKAALSALGKDIGESIDKIDWGAVLDGAKTFVGVMKSALDFVLLIVGALDKLPGEIKAAGLGFLALNKLSGGLVGSGVGNLVGGLAGTALRGVGANLPGVGKLFAQPVYIVGAAPGVFGGLGGPGGAAGAAGGGLAAAVRGAFIVTAAAAIADAVEPFTTGAGVAIHDALGLPKISLGEMQWPFGPKNTPTILPEVFGGNGALGGEATPTSLPGLNLKAPIPVKALEVPQVLKDIYQLEQRHGEQSGGKLDIISANTNMAIDAVERARQSIVTAQEVANSRALRSTDALEDIRNKRWQITNSIRINVPVTNRTTTYRYTTTQYSDSASSSYSGKYGTVEPI